MHFLFFHQVLKGRHISLAHGESHGRVVCVVEHAERGLSTVVEEPVYRLYLAEPGAFLMFYDSERGCGSREGKAGMVQEE